MVYDNIAVISKTGQFLSSISEKRKNWYLSRGLAEEIEFNHGKFTQGIKLKIEPKLDMVIRLSNTVYLENQCVLCGAKDKHLESHHVVPFYLKVHFPVELKENAAQWNVALCRECHNKADAVNLDIFKEYKQIFDKWFGRENKIYEKYQRIILSKNRLSKLDSRHINHILKQFGHYNLEELIKNAEIITLIFKKVLDDGYKQSVNYIIDKYSINGLKKIFREKFLSLAPKHLPEYWLTD